MKRILILDDNPLFNEPCTQPLINDDEYLVDLADDVPRAERLVQNKTYDLVVIDIMLPTVGTDCDKESIVGFKFYKEQFDGKNDRPLVLFWSHLTDASYKAHRKTWKINDDDKSVDFLKKEKDTLHLLNKVNEMFNTNM